MSDSMIAPCGIDCSECDIYKAANDPQLAEETAKRWRETWQPRAEADWFKCQGCRADRTLCWSEDCKIYACVTERGLDSCSDCGDFACEMLQKWAADYANHQAAFERLKGIREK